MKPRLLDLFCSAGGATRGYQMAGFHVTGVDIKPQPRYVGDAFHQADALAFVREHGHEFDAIHASPPCQAFTALKGMWNSREHPDLLTPTRELLQTIGKPYVIENVPGAPMQNHIVLCGSMFQLGCSDAELRRHRHFETWPFLVIAPRCNHGWKQKVIGVYGGHGRDRRRVRPATIGVYGDGNGRDYRRNPVVTVTGNAGGRSVRDGTQGFSTAERAEAMGIDWMTGDQLSQAIPPAYTEFIGTQLMTVLSAKEEAA